MTEAAVDPHVLAGADVVFENEHDNNIEEEDPRQQVHEGSCSSTRKDSKNTTCDAYSGCPGAKALINLAIITR